MFQAEFLILCPEIKVNKAFLGGNILLLSVSVPGDVPQRRTKNWSSVHENLLNYQYFPRVDFMVCESYFNKQVGHEVCYFVSHLIL